MSLNFLEIFVQITYYLGNFKGIMVFVKSSVIYFTTNFYCLTLLIIVTVLHIWLKVKFSVAYQKSHQSHSKTVNILQYHKS